MRNFDKQLKYSIRKVSVGAASVVIGAFYLAMGAGVVHAETNATEGGTSHSSSSPEPDTSQPNSLASSSYGAEPAPNPTSLLAGVAHSVKEETETKTVTRTIKYVDASDESKEVSARVTQTVTLERKQGTNEWTTGKWEAQTSPKVEGYSDPNQPTVDAKEVTSSTEDEEVLVYYSSSSSETTTSTRGRRVRRDTENTPSGGTATETGTSETSTETTVKKKEPVVDPNRKGETVKDDQPGVNVPKGDEEGADDPNAHLTFKKPGENATVEEMWKIIQNMPDDFQNNERSYLRNMDTLGDNLRFDKDGNVTNDPNGQKLQPGEIREISSFGGWKAIMKKDGTTGKFAVGMKNEQGYFTGWYTKDGKREEGGMLGSNALDEIYVHEQALERRFKYMLMLAKGRTLANKDDKAQDGSEFDIRTPKNNNNEELNKLPVKEKEDKIQHAPNIEGFYGIEKTFKAFSTEYGSRLKIDFVTGYISDYEGSKGTYRIVVKAIKKDKTEETIYDHTINRIDGVVENEERYAQGVDLSGVNKVIKDLLKLEYDKKVNKLVNEKYKEKYPTERKKDPNKVNALKEEVRQEFAKKGETTVELPIDKEKLEGTGKLKNNFKEELNFTEPYATVANKLNNELKKMKDEEVKKTSPIWMNGGDPKAKDPDRVYKLLNFVLPTAKKIIYHADTDQLELQTDPEKVKSHRAELTARLKTKEASLAGSTDEEEKTKLKKEISALESAIRSTNSYTYLEARNGSKDVKILGSHMKGTEKPSNMSDTDYAKYGTNESAAKYRSKNEDGLAVFTANFVEKYKVTRSNVLPDAELSKKITEAIGGDEDKLGKGGYFSTGDIPLAKDVVAYKIQVFAENEKRVGVNMQSPRLQYNLPILADFSVTQDTVESSKEVSRRILTKLKEKGKITEEEEKKIKDKIDKAKKTSELRSAMSGNVKVRYVDKAGNVITNIKDEKTFGEKDSENRYTAAKDVLINSEYNVAARAYKTLSTTDDKYYRLVADHNGLATGSAPVTGRIDTVDDKVVTFVYEETVKPKVAKATVTIRNENNEALAEFPDLHLESTPNTEFPSDSVTSTVEKLKAAGYTITTNTFDTTSKVADDIDDSTTVSQTYTITVTKQKPQTIEFKFVDVTDGRNKEVEKYSFTGNTNEKLTIDNINDVKKTLTKLKERGYVIENVPVLNTIVYDNEDDGTTPSQIYKINIREPKVVNTETREVTRTIHYVFKDGTKAHDDVIQKATFERTLTTNMVTALTDYGKWSGNGSLAEVVSPEIEHHSVDNERITAIEVTSKSDNIEVTVTYKLKLPTPPTVEIPEAKIGKAVVHFEKKVSDTETEALNGYPDMTLAGEVGGKFPSDEVEAKITELKKAGYEIVGDTFTNGNKIVDDKADAEDQTPSQEYTITVREKVKTVITPPIPNTPVDPNVPDGPKWPEAGLAKSDLEKEVTRTITYVKKETADGNKIPNAQPTKVDKVLYKRTATYNLVSKTVTYSDWTATADATHTATSFSSVKTPVLTGYVADIKEVTDAPAAPNANGEVTNMTREVVYTKLGSWVPKVPDGVKPPTGTEITPIPYPNDPDDPTKPKNPEYPETPETPTDPNKPTPPVIPYVPGYTPKIPTDPTKPVDPNTNPLVPLTPVDPKHPEKGYKVPPVPTTPNDPKTNTQIEYAADSQKAVIKFVVVGEDGKETELVTSRITTTGRTGQAIPTKTFNEELKKLTGDPVNNGDYELVGENPLKDGATFDNVKDQEGKDPSQVFVVKLRQIYVIPPTPRIVERRSGNTVEVDVPTKDADTLSITFTKRNSTEKETIVTKKDKDGTWKIEKSPDGVTINPTNGRVYIPSKQIQPKTLVDTQTKHKYKFSKIVSVMPTISDVEDFKGLTEWIDVDGNVLRKTEPGLHEKGRIANHVWLESRLEGNKVTHIFFAGSPSVDKPEEYKITIWIDEAGNPLKPDQPGTHEAGTIPGYRFIKTTKKDGVTIHQFEKITPVDPNEPIPDRPEEPRPQPNPEHPSAPTPSPELPNQEIPIPVPDTPSPETPVSPDPEVPTYETGKREELPNTGTEANAGLATLGLLGALGGFGLLTRKKEED